MATDEPRRNLGAWLKTRFLLAVNVALFALAAWAFAGEFGRNRELAVQVTAASEDVALLMDEYVDGETREAQYADPDFAEREARLKLNLRRPGEEVVVLRGGLSEGPDERGAPAEDRLAEDDVPNPVGWWRYFFR